MTATSERTGRIGDGHAQLQAGADQLLLEMRAGVTRELEAFVEARRAEWRATGSAPEILGTVLRDVVHGGKLLRSSFIGLGWRSGGPVEDVPAAAAMRVGAAVELVHMFALMQDDVMDRSTDRRGRAAVHVRLARWYAEHGYAGDPDRFGESAAILLSDLCLVWAERMWRESGMDRHRLWRAWSWFDARRSARAAGQRGDLLNDAAATPSLDRVLDVARRKSGDYTVAWPLQIGAGLAGCADPVLAALRSCGGSVGEAFQLRDDLIGVLGDPAETGKPVGDDLRDGKATSLVVLARDLSDGPARREMAAFSRSRDLASRDLSRWRELIVASGAPERIEQMITERVVRGRAQLVDAAVDPLVVAALDQLTDRHVTRQRSVVGGRGGGPDG